MKIPDGLSRARKHLGRVAAVFFVSVVMVAVGVGYFAYIGLEKQLTQSAQQQAQLQGLLSQTQEQAAEATAAALTTQHSLDVEKEKSAQLAEDFSSSQEYSKQQIAELEGHLLEISSSTDGSEIVDEWAPRVGKVICKDSVNNAWGGSGTAFKGSEGSVFVLTNFHVVTGSNYCMVGFPGDSKWYYVFSDQIGWDSSPYDWAYLRIIDPTAYLSSSTASVNFCGENQTTTGDKILVLGFPGTGATDDVTATQGIISGPDGEYLVTDAKIDHGNSGGAAIDVASDCFVGMPTAAKTGEIESYGRILNISFIDDLVELRL